MCTAGVLSRSSPTATTSPFAVFYAVPVGYAIFLCRLMFPQTICCCYFQYFHPVQMLCYAHALLSTTLSHAPQLDCFWTTGHTVLCHLTDASPLFSMEISQPVIALLALGAMPFTIHINKVKDCFR